MSIPKSFDIHLWIPAWTSAWLFISRRKQDKKFRFIFLNKSQISNDEFVEMSIQNILICNNSNLKNENYYCCSQYLNVNNAINSKLSK